MRYFKYLLSLLLITSCVNLNDPFTQDLTQFVNTRSDAPLEQTVWRHTTNEEYDKFVVFHDEQITLFYGCIEDNKVQRWSDCYSAKYSFENGKIVTDLSYPQWGKKEYTEKANIIKNGNGFTLYINDDLYEFINNDLTPLDEMWMTITVNIVPWN